jgi:hypothetical protein
MITTYSAAFRCRFEGRKPAFCVGLRRMARVILDQGHRQILLQRRRLHHARNAPDACVAKETPGKVGVFHVGMAAAL